MIVHFVYSNCKIVILLNGLIGFGFSFTTKIDINLRRVSCCTRKLTWLVSFPTEDDASG